MFNSDELINFSDTPGNFKVSIIQLVASIQVIQDVKVTVGIQLQWPRYTVHGEKLTCSERFCQFHRTLPGLESGCVIFYVDLCSIESQYIIIIYYNIIVCLIKPKKIHREISRVSLYCENAVCFLIL